MNITFQRDAAVIGNATHTHTQTVILSRGENERERINRKFGVLASGRLQVSIDQPRALSHSV